MKLTSEERERLIVQQASLIIDKANRLIDAAMLGELNLDLVNLDRLNDANYDLNILFREIKERRKEDANDEE